MATDNNSSTLTIRILGRDYPVACPENEREALLSSAEFLSRRMQAIHKKGKTLGIDRVAVMAALNTTRELLSLQREVKELRTRMQDSGAFMAAARTPDPARDEGFDQRLAQLQLRIENALTHSD